MQVNTSFDESRDHHHHSHNRDSPVHAEGSEVAVDEPEHQQPAVLGASRMDWSNPSIMCQVLSFLVPDPQAGASGNAANAGGRTKKRGKTTAADRGQQALEADIESTLAACHGVCKSWAMCTYIITARRRSDFEANKILSFNYSRWLQFVSKFCWGRFLSQGACKDVYCIQNPSNGRLEAVSVMDIDDLKARDMQSAITQELQISMLTSSLVTLKICPNLVQIYSLFQSDYGAPVSVWTKAPPKSLMIARNKAAKLPLVPSDDAMSFQYIRMEFCTGGDMEELLRKVLVINPSQIRAFLFQMCFSLYTCREKLMLRHFDVKLLLRHVRPVAPGLSGRIGWISRRRNEKYHQ
jgi:hypothetical protein